MSSGTRASRGSSAGSALAVMDLEDIPRQYIRALALRVWGQGGEGRVCICDLHCASVGSKTSKAGLKHPSNRYSVSVHPEHMAGSAAAS